MTSRFLTSWVLTAAVVVSIAGISSLLVDPYGLFRFIDVVGVNQQKEGARNKIRFVKALELPLRRPETLLMGSSRVHDAMDPEHPLLQEFSPVYNLGVDMNRIHETRVLLRHATENTNVKRVVLGLDFFMFNSAQRANFDFDETLIGRKVGFADYLGPSILSKDAVLDSIRTIRASAQQPGRREFLPNGYRPQAFYGIKNYANAHYYTNWIFLTSKPQNTMYYSGMALHDEVFDEFEAILVFCYRKRIDLRLYINPAHAHLDGEGIRALGKLEMFENWKRRLTEIAGRHNVPLWDFSGYNSVTTEPVKTPMKYYWDSSHFTETVEDWILKRIFGSDDLIPADFGLRLTAKNIEAHLDAIRRDRERYVIANRSMLLALENDYKAIIDGAPLDPSRLKEMY
jgi:hypothetical protein